MFNLLKVEFYKLKTSKMFYSTMLLNLLQVVVVYIFSQRFRLMNGKDALLFMFNMQNGLALGILIGIFASDYIVTEFTSGYIKNLISYGHKRISIFASKSIAFYTGIIIISVIPPLLVMGINTVGHGYGEIFTFNSLIFLIKILLLMVISYIAIGSISVLVAFTSRSVNITISIIVALDFINRTLNVIAIQKPSLDFMYDKFILSQPTIMLSDKSGFSELLQSVSIVLITLIIATVVGNYIFKKADIK
jgi:ABC-2 type transport system permease protein